MIRGEKISLEPEAQRTVAVWLGLKSIVLRHAHSPVQPVDDDWLRYFAAHKQPPKSWHIWIASYYGSVPCLYEGRDITISISPEPPDGTDLPSTPHGVLMTLIIGYFAAKLLGIREGIPTGPGADHWFSVWPLLTHRVDWPPALTIKDDQLDGFRRLYTEQ
jgi:hypothetical protein